MRLVELGKTGLEVSEVGFGGIPIQRLGHEEAVRVVKACLDHGVNLIDTAQSYTTSEERIGEAIRGRREQVVLATKTMAQTGAEVETHLELSLRRLGVDYIDLYQFHHVSSAGQWQNVSAPGGPLDTVREAQCKGLVRHIGVTCHQSEIAQELVRSGHFETIMFPFNFIACEPGLEVLRACRSEGVAFLAMKPLAGGVLESASLAFQYLREFADVVPVVGIQHPEEIAEIAELYDTPPILSEADRAEMERIRAEIGTSVCRRCDYCQPCPAAISISTVMHFPTLFRKLPPERLLARGGEGRHVEAIAACQGCGVCETRCPYRLPIRDRLAAVLAFYHAARQEYVAAHPESTEPVEGDPAMRAVES